MQKSYTLFDIPNLTAKYLLELNAVEFRPDKPFVFTSGRSSPVYIDVRRICGCPAIRAKISWMACNLIYKKIGRDSCHVVAGGETAGIPIAVMMADRMHKPLAYIRKTPKGFGKSAQIEGLSFEQLNLGQRFLLVEDLISEGGSKRNFINAIRVSGNIVTDVFVVFDYVCLGAEAVLQEEGVNLHAMTTLSVLIDVAEDLNLWEPDLIGQARYFVHSGGQFVS